METETETDSLDHTSHSPRADRVRSLTDSARALGSRIQGGFARLADSRIGNIFSLDLRSLALLRIFLGLLVIADLAGRVPNFRAHFTENGVLPRELLVSGMSDWRWSVYLINSSDQFTALLFVLTWVAAILMIVGFRTRLMLFIVWALIVSLQVRNPIVLSGADTLLRLSLFWAMLLPLGAVWSVDNYRKLPAHRPTSMRYVSFAGAGLLVQIAIMYWFTAILKDGASWRGDGTALFYATGAGQINQPIGEYLHQFPDLLKIMTYLGVGTEAIAPLLLFIPFRRGIFRIPGIIAIVSLHIGIMLIMDVALFPWTSSLVMAAFLPEAFWIFAEARSLKLSRWLDRRTSRPRIPQVVSGAPSLSAAGAGGSGDPVGSFDEARSGMISTFLRRVMTSLPATQQSTPAGQGVDGEHRRSVRSSWLLNAFAAFMIVFVVAWNIPSVSAYRMPSESAPIAYGLAVYQKWNMFAPNPPNATVWYVVRGYVDGGEQVDLVTPFVYDDIGTAHAFSWDEPDNIVSGYYKDKYWRKYFSAIATDDYDDERMQFARYACRNWNAHYGGDARLDKLQMIMVKRPTLLDGTQGEETRRLIGQYSCA